MDQISKNFLNQELNDKSNELAAQRRVRELHLVDLTLRRIADGVESKEADIQTLMDATKGKCQVALREMVVREVKRSADGLLWCREYIERLKSDQLVHVFTGSHWQSVEPQQWKDFVTLCANRCGVPEQMLMNPVFMKALFEGLAFNLAEYRKQMIPDGEVWLNVSNGTLVIKSDGSVTLRDHDKRDLFFYCLNYCYDSEAECPLWLAFLDRVLPDADAQLLLAEFIGYCLMPGHELEKMLLLYGEGLNGKSVTLEVIESLLGSVNVSYLSLADLTNDDVKRAGIEDKMLNISHESGKDVNPNVLKQLTSGVLPRAENTFGFFRRLLILAYQVTIPKEEIDRQLASKLKGELPGILCWVLKALPALMSRCEFSPCESSEKALEQYRLQSDNVRLFLNDACEASEYTTQASELFTAYRNYCFGSSLKPIGKKKFYDRLESLGYERVMYANTLYFKLKVTEQ